jgi:hypothetical protein
MSATGLYIPPHLTTACTRRPFTESFMYVAQGRG